MAICSMLTKLTPHYRSNPYEDRKLKFVPDTCQCLEDTLINNHFNCFKYCIEVLTYDPNLSFHWASDLVFRAEGPGPCITINGVKIYAGYYSLLDLCALGLLLDYVDYLLDVCHVNVDEPATMYGFKIEKNLVAMLCCHTMDYSVLNENKDKYKQLVIKLIEKYNAKADGTWRDFTCLYGLQDYDFMKFLIDHGADLDHLHNNNFNILTFYLNDDQVNLKCLELLCTETNINQIFKDDKTVLMKSLYIKDLECFKFLVNRSKNINNRDSSGVSVLDKAKKYCKNQEIIKILEEAGAV